MSHQPWMKWYPVDWRGDPRLRMCSLAARGLWADLISYMHEGEPYGHLVVDGHQPSESDIAALVSRPVNEVKKALAELSERQVFSLTADGAIYSRRMVRDHDRSEEGRRQVEKRWKGKVGGPNRSPNRPPNRGPTDDPTTQKLEARSQIEGESETGASARGESLISPDAFEVSAEIIRASGKDRDNPGHMGLSYAVQTWLNEKISKDFILEKAIPVASKHLNYIAKVVRTEWSIRSLHEIAQPAVRGSSSHAKAPQRGAITAHLERRIREFEEAERDAGGGNGEGSHRLLSHG